MRRQALIILTVGLLLPVQPAPASDAAAERVPITDPALLEELGFPLDAQGIYALPGALERLLDPPSAEVEPEPPYGTADRSYTGVSSVEFTADLAAVLFRNLATRELYCADANNWAFASAQIPLPTGASLEVVNFYASDFHSTHNATLFVDEVCQNLFGGPPEVTVLGSVSTIFSGRQLRTLVFDPTVTIRVNSGCTYNARIRFSNSNDVCVGSDIIALSHVSAGWKRQISPAPDTATFDDVPTEHIFFRHIEALADSAITSGCDADNFCPDAPLTRGQMAVFLAKALGLHWPG